MRILYDDNMPYAAELFPLLGEARSFNHQNIHAADFASVEALMIRSTTKVDDALLSLSPHCRFVATATAGTNHMHFAALNARNINHTSAAGCNAESVAEYALAAALHGLCKQQKIDVNDSIDVFETISVGVIGVGQVGRRVAHKFASLGCEVVLSDPPRAKAEGNWKLDQLEQVLQCDVICCHAPLVKDGEFPSFHILNEQVLAALQNEQLLINAGRGEIINNQALLTLKRQGDGPMLVLDVWENEPDILSELIPYCEIATPHIAGHSLEGKARGTFMLFEWLCEQVGATCSVNMNNYLPNDDKQVSCHDETLSVGTVKTLVESIYDITIDHSEFVQNMAQSNRFAQLRKQYRNAQYNPNTITRREFATLKISCSHTNTQTLLSNLGFQATLVL